MLQSIIFITSLLTISSTTQFKVSSCGSSTDLMQNVVLFVSPALPQTDYILYLNGDLNNTVTQGTSTYDITYNFIPFSPYTNDLCTEINTSNITCPLQVGHLSSESKGSIANDVSGTVTIKNQWFNENNQRILCMLFNIKI